MSSILELGSTVRARRSDMGLTQTTLAKLSGLSRVTVNQLEKGAVNDLSLTRATKLLAVLGLSINVAAARPTNPQFKKPKSPALDLAARTANVSHRVAMNADQLRTALTNATAPVSLLPHIHSLLEEASVSLLASVVEQLHQELGVERTQVWQRMRDLARQLQSNRAIWL